MEEHKVNYFQGIVQIGKAQGFKTCARSEIIIIIMVIFKCYFSREHIALSYEKWCEHRIRKKQQIKSTANDEKSYLK